MPDAVEQEVTRMRPGMTLAERRELRDEILEQALEGARVRAALVGLSARCLLEHRTAGLSADQRHAEHVKCQGESTGGGCLCENHDKDAPGQPAG